MKSCSTIDAGSDLSPNERNAEVFPNTIDYHSVQDAGSAISSAGTETTLTTRDRACPIQYLSTLEDVDSQHGTLEVSELPLPAVLVSNRTPLQVAIQMRNQPMTQLLLSKGADVSRQDSSSATALHFAAETGQLELVSTILAAGGRVDDVDYSGHTAIFKAVQGGSLEVLRLLLEYNADPNVRDIWGDTPLHLAAKIGVEKLALLLLDHGAEVDAPGGTDAPPTMGSIVGASP